MAPVEILRIANDPASEATNAQFLGLP